jgi:hypothetical protein
MAHPRVTSRDLRATHTRPRAARIRQRAMPSRASRRRTAFQPLDELADARQVVHQADALARAPDVLPRLRLAAAEIIFDLSDSGSASGSRRRSMLADVVAVHAGEQVRIDDVRRFGVEDRVLVRFDRVRFLRRDEARAHVGQIGAHRLRGEDRAAVRDRARQHDRPVEHPRTSPTSANGDVVPAWPPAPAATRISPSTPASSAFCAWRRLMTSCSTMPP